MLRRNRTILSLIVLMLTATLSTVLNTVASFVSLALGAIAATYISFRR